MKPITAERIAKAEADFATAVRESRVRKKPNYDGICFHCQQLRPNVSAASFARQHEVH